MLENTHGCVRVCECGLWKVNRGANNIEQTFFLDQIYSLCMGFTFLLSSNKLLILKPR